MFLLTLSGQVKKTKLRLATLQKSKDQGGLGLVNISAKHKSLMIFGNSGSVTTKEHIFVSKRNMCQYIT